MKKALFVVALAILLSGCGRFDRWWAGQTGGGVSSCEGGVMYLQFTSGVSVAYNTDGTIKTCG